MAPEVLRCPTKSLPQENKNNTRLHYNNSVDAWAVGVFAFELVVGFPPFSGETQTDSVDMIMNTTINFPESVSINIKTMYYIIITTVHGTSLPEVCSAE